MDRCDHGVDKSDFGGEPQCSPYAKLPGEFVRSMRRRCRCHDYRDRCMYLLTMNKARDIPDLCRIAGDAEADVRVELSASGQIYTGALRDFLKRNPKIKLLTSTVMPDHVHVLLRVVEYLEKPLGTYVRYLKAGCTSAYAGIRGSSVPMKFFSEGFHDRICCGAGQRQRMYEYVTDNPRRRWVVTHNRDYFMRMERLRFDDAEKYVNAYGNRFLLDEPEMSVVRFSRRFTAREFEEMRERWLDVAENGGVLVSPFIHPEERRVREDAIRLGAKIIHIRANGFEERHKPSGHDFELCSQGRLLEIAPSERRAEWEKGGRELFMRMNAFAGRIADYARRHGGLGAVLSRQPRS